MTLVRLFCLLPLAGLLALCGCSEKKPETATKPATAQPTPAPKPPPVGLVTSVGGRGDQSFNDSALRGLELWAAGKRYSPGGYVNVSKEELQESIPQDLRNRQPPLSPLSIQPLVLQSRTQEDYEPNFQLLVDQGVTLAIGTGFMLMQSVKTVAKRNPNAKFLLIDTPLLDEKGAPISLPNVRSVVFREEQGSFLVGALAGLATQTNTVAFVGGMEIPPVKKAEIGFRSGVMATNPKAKVLVVYTGSFDNVAAGKQVGQDLLLKKVDVIFQGAGSDGLGVIQAVKEARAAGKQVFAIGVDSDQFHLAPNAVLTSMLKRVDLAVYEAIRDSTSGAFQGGDRVMGLKESGVTYAEVRLEFPGKAEALQKVEALRHKVAAGEIKIPVNAAELATFQVAPGVPARP
jgi:basic membrane protein A